MENQTQVVIKVHIETLGLDLEIEIKRENDLYKLIIVRSKSKIPGDQGQIWHATTKNEKSILEIATLANECYQNPSKSRYITINDGMHATFTVIHGKTISFKVTEFEVNTLEVMLLTKLIKLCKESGIDASFDKYVSEVENHLRSR